MTIAVVYDNRALPGFRSGWGFSCLVDDRVLFDTGEEAESLFFNLERLNVDTRRIEAVVISHDHWDHTGGLEGLLARHPGLPVYGCPGFSSDFRERVRRQGGRLIECALRTKITSEIATTGEIPGTYKGGPMPEQALLVETEQGLTVITGCSHPGVLRMLPAQPVKCVVGGFHLKDSDPKEIEAVAKALERAGVERVGPTHCSGAEAEAIFARRFGKNFLKISAGSVGDF
ncbi:MBL fold metallo-hydrolase [candidate division KSB1 bacterium]|nr:MBL fold metallo-hydrolase [candidate division KSB1 bacterium]